MRLLSLFSGIGAFETALKNLNVNYELVAYCEIDRYAAQAYSQVHGVPETLNLHDVTAVDTTRLPRDLDLITYGFPCQDISIAGRQKGFTDERTGERTRSGLFFEALRIIKDTQPRYAVAENVKALTSAKFKAEFETVLRSLEEAGYNNYYKVLNAKDYGIPQNRERVFIVSVRKDIDMGTYHFPEPVPLALRLRDMLEESVDEKYYLSGERVDRLLAEIAEKYAPASPTVCALRGRDPTDPQATGTYEQRPEINPRGVTNSLTTVLKDNYILEPATIDQVGNLEQDAGFTNPQRGRVYGSGGLAPSIDSMNGGNREPKVVVTEPAPALNVPGNLMPDYKIANPQEGRVYGSDGLAPSILSRDYKDPPRVAQLGNLRPDAHFANPQAGRVYSPDGVAPSLCESCAAREPRVVIGEPVMPDSAHIERVAHRGTGGLRGRIYSDGGVSPALSATEYKDPVKHTDGLRIRKLTPLECWRLMGFTDADFDRVRGASNSQLYKQAGNSIVVQVAMGVLRGIIEQEELRGLIGG